MTPYIVWQCETSPADCQFLNYLDYWTKQATPYEASNQYALLGATDKSWDQLVTEYTAIFAKEFKWDAKTITDIFNGDDDIL